MQNRLHRIHVAGPLLLGLACLLPPAARAQEPSQDVAELRAELRALRAELEALKRLVAAGQPVPGAPVQAPEPDPLVAMLREQVAEQAQVKVESKSRMPVTLSGTIVANTYANSGDANWLENPNIVSARTGPTGSFGSTLRHTHLALSLDGPTLGDWRATGFVAMDFLGGAPGFQTGTVMGLPRLLYAFACLERDRTAVEIGQDTVILAPRDPTSLAAPAFPLLFRSGNLYLRAPQIRVEQRTAAGLDLRAGIVTPLAGDFGPDYAFAPVAGAGERSRTPAVQARVGYRRERDTGALMDVGVSGHYGRERRASSTRDQWASAIDWNLQGGRLGFGGEAYTGEALSAFGGALGQPVRSTGGFAELRLKAHERLSFNGGGGLDEVARSDRRRVALRRNRTWFGNAIVTLTPELATSIEYRFLETRTATNVDRTNHHVNLTFAYSF